MPSMQEIKILLIEDNPGDARLIREALSSTGEDVEVKWADRLATGLERIETGAFDAVLLDLSLPDSRGLATFERVHGRAPELPIVVLTGLDDQDLALRAVGDGAQDYLVKGTVKPDVILRVVRFAIERCKAMASAAARRAPGKIVGFLGAKGGSGTTTVVLNIAAALAREGESVVAVEMSPYRSGFSLQLRLSPRRDLADLTKLEAGKIDAVELRSHLVLADFGAHLLFAPQEPQPAGDLDEPRLEALLRAATDLADYVLLDLPSTPSALHQPCARLCDPFLLVMERGPMGVAAGRNALPLFRLWGLEKGCLGSILVTKDPMSAYVSSAQVAIDLGLPVTSVIPPAAEALAAAHKLGAPLVITDPESLPSESLQLLAKRLAAPVLTEAE
jgi:DNA-binding response OmpR family regulator